MLSILENKGHLRHEARANRYLYLPTVPPGKAQQRALRDIIRTFFRGSPKDAVVALLDEAGDQLSPQDLEELRARIERAKKQSG